MPAARDLGVGQLSDQSSVPRPVSSGDEVIQGAAAFIPAAHLLNNRRKVQMAELEETAIRERAHQLWEAPPVKGVLHAASRI
jgi:hypothetical protein